jgi:hypothetical protein
MIGTMVLVLMGCGSAAVAANPGADASGLGVAFVGVALAFGLSVLVMVYAIGGISGCHINPAISFAMWINKRLDTKDMIMYWIFQMWFNLAYIQHEVLRAAHQAFHTLTKRRLCHSFPIAPELVQPPSQYVLAYTLFSADNSPRD